MMFNKKFKFKSVLAILAMFILSAGCLAQLQLQAGRIDARVVDSGESPILEGPSVLQNEGYFVWGGSVIKGEDGKYHMFYSRWPAGPHEDPFSDGWLTGSEIAYAVSDHPDRDFEFVKVVLRGRMHEGRPDAWDAQSVHNPHIKRFNDRYYLYHTGSRDPGEQTSGSPGAELSKRNRIQQSQKLGVIEFSCIDDLLAGNFLRPDTPMLSPRTRVKKDHILNPSPEGTRPMPDNIIVVNPSVVYRPSDKKYLLFFKGNLYEPYWKGAHGVALSDSPTGPFEPLDQFVFNIKDSDGKMASAEDPYVWFSRKDDRFYAVFKDFTGKFTGQGPGLAIMASRDGAHWSKMPDPMFMPLELQLKGGATVKVNRLERPQLLISEDGSPRVLYTACSLSALNDKKDGSSFNVQIPLEESKEPIAFGTFYLSPRGNDQYAGDFNHPVATFEAAQYLVRDFKEAHPGLPVKVYIRGGKYYLKEPVVFKPEDSGSRTGAIIYKAFPGEQPLLLGGVQLHLNWKPYKEGIYKAQVPEGLIFESLYINDTAMVMARYPNYNPNARIYNGTAADCISPSKVRQWKNPKGGYFHVLHKALWGGFHFRIAGKKSPGDLILQGGNQNNRPENGLHEELRYVENIFEELDTINEWYLDREKSLLYFKPPQGLDLNNANVEVASLPSLMEFRGSEVNPVKYITIDGLAFRRTTRTFMQTTDRLLRSDWTIYRGGTLLLEGTQHCTIHNCTLEQLGGNAIFVNNYNRFATISGCHITEIGASGICLVGDTLAVRNPNYNPYGSFTPLDELDFEPGPKNNNYPARCLVENNLIHSTGTVEKQSAGVQISMASEITVRHNSIYDLPRAGINIGEGAWGGHLLEFNDVFSTVLETGDHGSFNSWGRDRFWRANGAETEKRVKLHPGLPLLDVVKPIILRNNRFRCDHGWDIDLDDGSSNYIVENNLCLVGGIKLREGYYRTVRNNICLNNALHPHVWYQNSGDVVRGNIWGSAYWPIRVPDWGTEVDYNLFYVDETPDNYRIAGTDQNAVIADPLFVDAAKGDFRVLPQSPAHALGFKNFEMDRFGVQVPHLKALARTPDIPVVKTMERSSDNSLEQWYGGTIKNLETLGEQSATGMWALTGVLVVEASVESSLYQMGFRENDVIIEVNGTDITGVSRLQQRIEQLKNEREVKVVVWRDQGKVEVRLR